MKYPVLIVGIIILLIGLAEYVAGMVLLPRIFAGLSSRIVKKSDNKDIFNFAVIVKCLIGIALIILSFN